MKCRPESSPRKPARRGKAGIGTHSAFSTAPIIVRRGADHRPAGRRSSSGGAPIIVRRGADHRPAGADHRPAGRRDSLAKTAFFATVRGLHGCPVPALQNRVFRTAAILIFLFFVAAQKKCPPPFLQSFTRKRTRRRRWLHGRCCRSCKHMPPPATCRLRLATFRWPVGSSPRFLIS